MSLRWWDQFIDDDLQQLAANHLLRKRSVTRPIDATHVLREGRTYVNFASNDYLGLTHHPELIEAAQKAVAEFGTGSGAAPLITAYGPAHEACELGIAEWKGTEAAMLLPSGYQANHAAIQAAAAAGGLAGGTRFLVDKLAHASLIDAIRATREPFRVFPHNHLSKLRRLLEEAPAGQLQVVITESIFSMDGDAADLQGLAQLREKFGFMLVLDEAHAGGVFGPNGSGLAAELNLRDAIDVSVITLSKALGGIGGAVCGPSRFCQFLINHSPAYLFSTSIPAAAAAIASKAIELLQREPARQARVRHLAREMRAALGEMGFEIPPGQSPIIPIILGSEQAALAAADQLHEAGLLTVAIRPPTVPRGTSRLRITVSSQHGDEEIERLLNAMRLLRK